MGNGPDLECRWCGHTTTYADAEIDELLIDCESDPAGEGKHEFVELDVGTTIAPDGGEIVDEPVEMLGENRLVVHEGNYGLRFGWLGGGGFIDRDINPFDEISIGVGLSGDDKVAIDLTIGEEDTGPSFGGLARLDLDETGRLIDALIRAHNYQMKRQEAGDDE